MDLKMAKAKTKKSPTAQEQKRDFLPSLPLSFSVGDFVYQMRNGTNAATPQLYIVLAVNKLSADLSTNGKDYSRRVSHTECNRLRADYLKFKETGLQ